MDRYVSETCWVPKATQKTLVPFRYNEDSKLGMWVGAQRRLYKKDELKPNRVDLLNSIGFKWVGGTGGKASANEKWMNMFQKLVEYWKQHKNTLVPFRYNEDPKLGMWVGTQRKNQRNDTLLPNRCALLNSIGFNWDWIRETKGKVNGNYVATTTS